MAKITDTTVIPSTLNSVEGNHAPRSAHTKGTARVPQWREPSFCIYPALDLAWSDRRDARGGVLDYSSPLGMSFVFKYLIRDPEACFDDGVPRSPQPPAARASSLA